MRINRFLAVRALYIGASVGLLIAYSSAVDRQVARDAQPRGQFASSYISLSRRPILAGKSTPDSAPGFPWPTKLTVPTNPPGRSNDTYAVLPPNELPGNKHPWVIYITGHAQPGCAIMGCSGWPNQGALTAALARAGFVVVAIDMSSLTNWGNANATLDVRALANLWPRYLNLASRPYVIAESMGGIIALNSIAHGTLRPQAIVGIYPVYSLSSMYAAGAGTFAREIQAAYGFRGPSSYAAATSAYDPALVPASTFASIPMWISCSSGDTAVNCAANGQALVNAVNEAGGSATYNPATGNHGDISNFDTAAVVSFFESH